MRKKLTSRETNVFISMMVFFIVTCVNKSVVVDDQFIWLENKGNSKVKKWIKEQNNYTIDHLVNSPLYKEFYKSELKNLNDDRQLPPFKVHGEYIYVVRKNGKKRGGVWQRKKISSFRNSRWENVLDIDKLSRKEGKKMNFSSSTCLKPKEEDCLIEFSIEGGDSVVIREFNIRERKFIKNGFNFEKGKTRLAWIDKNSILISSDLFGGKLTNAGYGRDLHIFNRSSNIPVKKSIISVPDFYLMNHVKSVDSKNGPLPIAIRYHSATEFDSWLIEDKIPIKIDVPSGTYINGICGDDLIVSIKKKWKLKEATFYPDSLVAIDLRNILNKSKLTESSVRLVYRPRKGEFLQIGTQTTLNKVIVPVVKAVKNYLVVINNENGNYKRISNKTDDLSGSILSGISYFDDIAIVKSEDFLTPPSYFSVDLGRGKSTVMEKNKVLFQSSGMFVEQRWVSSKDGVLIPYFVIGKKDVIKMGNAPVVLNAYGAYGVSLSPWYLKSFGPSWLEKGGLLVVANIRGGGEFGEKWHRAAVKETKYKSIEDLISVSDHLINSGLTTGKKLGLYGGSMAGFVLASAMIKKPDNFNAVVNVVPVIDLIRGKKLIKANWLGEVGDPDNPEERAYILDYSPYHNMKLESMYPNYFSYAPTNDDRVDPANARKMVAKLKKGGNKNVFYYEDSKGGHFMNADNDARARWKAMQYVFFSKYLKLFDK